MTAASGFYKSRQRLLQITAAAFTNHGSGFYKSRQRLLQITAASGFYKSRQRLLQITAAAFTNHGGGFYKSRPLSSQTCPSRAEVGSFVSSSGCSGEDLLRFGGRNTNHDIPRQIASAVTPNHDINFVILRRFGFVRVSLSVVSVRCELFTLRSLSLRALPFRLPSRLPSPSEFCPPLFSPLCFQRHRFTSRAEEQHMILLFDTHGTHAAWPSSTGARHSGSRRRPCFNVNGGMILRCMPASMIAY